MDFEARYQALNEAQRRAVDTIDGPVMVVAGPGTGKTELLSMRAANIIRRTDTLPENILCLTFTESGATAMRSRLTDIIGPLAYKVAIHTFHSFGSEVINQNREYFYRGAEFRPADELSQLQILHGIFDELPYDNILASKMNGDYTYLPDVSRSISHIKKSGLTSEELRLILDLNDAVMDAVETQVAAAFADRISKQTAGKLGPVIAKLNELALESPVPTIVPLDSVLAESLAHALAESEVDGKTTSITKWKNKWCEKDAGGKLVFKSRRRQAKLRALVNIYYEYLAKMEQAGLYDFDDMILNVIHTMETQPDLRFNLQEKYQYIMVDEFQDTNLAQMRILFDLTDNPVNEGRPNILVVGDDDQAIYSFQGADVGNIINFRSLFDTTELIPLTDNYRSAEAVLTQAREVILQGSDRLESHIPELDKTLTPHASSDGALVELTEHQTVADELAWVARSIRQQLDAGVKPSSIAVLARKHDQLEALLPYLTDENILVNYEHRDNILELDIITQIELVARIVVAIYEQRLDAASQLLPQLVSHPAWGYDAKDIWQLSLSAYKNRQSWLELMSVMPVFAPLHGWLLDLALRLTRTPLEVMLDTIIDGQHPEQEPGFNSPLRAYYFSEEKRAEDPEDYLNYLDALRTIRTKLRDYCRDQHPRLQVFLEYIDLHRQFDRTITGTRPASETIDDAIYLMSAHKSKGLEFDHVYIINAIEKHWGPSARGMSAKLTYPENMPLDPHTGSSDERLRLFYVAMTRAKKQLHISYSQFDEAGKDALKASFLVSDSLPPKVVDDDHSIETLTRVAELDWRAPILAMSRVTMQQLLAPTLEHYKLSATHINAFIDVTHGGPQDFLINQLLHFPAAMSPAAAYGTAVHDTLQRAHSHLTATGEMKPLEDILHDYEHALGEQQLADEDHATYLQKGSDVLTNFLRQKSDTFRAGQKTELNFAGQQVTIGSATLTGKLDLVDIDTENRTIIVTDYKTGKPSLSWQGKADYEKIKLHKYKQQLMFYKLLIENSRDYGNYSFEKGVLQFVEPTQAGDIVSLEATFDDEECNDFKRLIQTVWRHVTTLDLPNVSGYEPSYRGLLDFEQDLIDENV